MDATWYLPVLSDTSVTGFRKSKVAQYRRDPFHMSTYGTPTWDYLFCQNLAVLWYNSEVNH